MTKRHHRYYDPTTTQYLTPDPLHPITGERYGYTTNDPINGSDPTGLFSIPLPGDHCWHVPGSSSDNCDHSGNTRWAGNVFAGAGNALSFGQGVDAIAKVMGKGDNFTACNAATGSKAYRGGFIGGIVFGFGFAAASAADASAAAAASSGEAGITFGHGGRHLVGTGLNQTEVESAIQAHVQGSVSRASSSRSFWGRVAINGQTVEYRAFTLPNGTINVGTYYVP